MKKSKTLLCAILLLFTSGCGLFKPCDVKDGIACYTKKTNTFVVEENAKLKVAVPSEAYGIALQTLWDDTHPEQTGVIEPILISDTTARYYLENNSFDLLYMKEEEIPLLLGHIQPFHEKTVEGFQPYLPDRTDSVLNKEANRFIPMEYDGLLFAYNETILNEMGISLTDENQDGLPDAIDSWEKLFERATAYQQHYMETSVQYLFPLEFTERYTFYPLLSAGGWQLFSSLDASKPGFDTEEFNSSLRFIYELGKYDWNLNNPDQAIETVSYPYETVLLENNAATTMIARWMYYEEAETSAQENYRFAHMPSYDGNILTPFCTLTGYVLSADTSYPSAANELLRLIRSTEGLQAYLDTTEAVPYLKLDETLEITNENRRDMINAYAYSVSEPLVALANDTTIRGYELYYAINWPEVMMRLYKHEITVQTAQAEIVAQANEWLTANGALAMED